MNNLRATLGATQNKPLPAHIEHAIHTIVADNLDLACTVVQRAAAEAAVKTTEEQLSDATSARKNHREKSGRRLPFYDINFVGSSGYAFAQTLPESLKPKLGGIHPDQLQVYDDFVAPTGLALGAEHDSDFHPEAGKGHGFDEEHEEHELGTEVDSKSNWDVQRPELDMGMGVEDYPSERSYDLSTSIDRPPMGHAGHVSYLEPPVQQQQVGFSDVNDMRSDIGIGYGAGGHVNEEEMHERPEAYSGFPASPQRKLPDQQLDLISRTKKIDQFVSELMNALVGLQQIRTLSELPPNHPVVRMFSRVSTIVMSSQNKYEVSVYTAQIVFPKLFKIETKRALLHREACLTVIDVLVNVVPSIRIKIAELLIASPVQQKFHREVVPALLHYNLLAIHEYDVHLGGLVSVGDPLAVDFANYLLQNMVKTTALSPSDLICTLEALVQINPKDFELSNLVETCRGQASSTPALPEENIPATPRRKVRTEFDFSKRQIPEAARAKVVALFHEWLEIYGQGNDKSCAMFIQQIPQRGIHLSKDQPTEGELSFYQILIETALSHSKSLLNDELPDSRDGNSKSNYVSIDALAKFFLLLVKYFIDKPSLLARILGEVGRVVHQGQESLQYDQRAYYRIFSALLLEFNTPDPIFEPILLLLLLEFRDLFHYFQPSMYPGFTFAWLKLISHPMFMPKLLKAGPEQEGWVPMQELIVDLFTFMEPWLREAQLTAPIKLLYQGTLRTLLVLLHDFPEFLCNFHFSFCDVIPPSCIQLRNLILSAFPHTMKLPDPFIPNLKVDLLPEIKEPPHIQSNYWETLIQVGIKAHLDSFLRSCKPLSFLADLMVALRQHNGKFGQNYNIRLINSLVLYVGARALSEPGECSPQAPMEIFRYLAVNCDTEGRYLLFNAIANQLRYPNNQTHYFSCVLLFLFAEASIEIIQEQITRVLVERLIVHRPHPWGLLITFIELIKNPRYNFWSRSFTRCAPEIERLFYQVGTHIAQHKSE